MELILASGSSYRRALLDRLGLPYRVVRPDVDEGPVKEAAARQGITPRALAERLAMVKAESVAVSAADAVVLGSDQLAVVDGEVLGKPGTRERAIAQLQRLAGRSHELITALAIAHRGEIRLHTDVTTLRMRSLTREELERYVDADEPWDCAGSYKIEARGIVLFESIQCDDETAIIGLPLIALTSQLRELGFRLP